MRMATKTILIIDFDQKSLGSLKEALTADGYRVLTATDGQIGWDKFIDETPDLVIIEPMLSKLHGFELCQKITTHPEYKVPVFIMTGVYKDFIYKSEALRTYGASEYFEKPLNMETFAETVRRAVPIPQGEPKKAETPDPVPVKPPASAPPPLAAKAASPKKEPAFEVPTIEDLKFLVSEPAPKKEHEKRSDASASAKEGKDEIDAMLKSALSDFGLGEEKKKSPEKTKPAASPAPPVHTAPPPPPSARPAPKLEAVPRTPPPPPAPAKIRVEPAASKPEKGIFFGPPPGLEEVSKKRDDTNGDPQRLASRSEARRAEPVPVTPPKSPLIPKPEPPAAKPRPVSPPPAPAAAPKSIPRVIDRDTLSSEIREDLHEDKKKRGLPISLIVVASVVALGVSGYILLRPKPEPNGSLPQASVKPISAPAQVGANAVQSDPGPTQGTSDPGQTPEEFNAVVEKRAKEIESDLAAKAKASAESPPPQIVGAPVLSAPVNPEATDLEITPTKTERNGGETAAGNPALKSAAAKPPQQNPSEPPVKTGADGSAGDPASGAVSNPVPIAPLPTINEGDLIPLDEVDVAPGVLRRVNPVYPSLAQKFKLEGIITVNALVSETGSVIDTAILKGMKDDMGLEKAAADAVRKWRFEPAQKNGVNVFGLEK
jgi:TonB family protein